MSTTSASGAQNTSGNNQTAATKSPSGNASRADKTTQSPADQFASLLGLLSASDEVQLKAEGADPAALDTTPPDKATDDATGNPLAALLGWPGAPVLQTDLPTQTTTGAELNTADASKGLSDALGAATAGRAKTTGASTEGDAADLQGMTVLDQPVEADADLRASLEAATHGAGNHRSTATTTARADAAAFAARPANWRSTTALAHSASSAAATAAASTTHIQLGQAAQGRLVTDPGVSTSRSTLTLDDRFSGTSLGGGASPLLAGLDSRGRTGSQGGSDQPSAGSGAFADALSADRSEGGANEDEFELAPDVPGEELLPEEAALTPQQLRHASLRVGEGTDEAIDIQLALRGEQLNVDFRTDNTEARASLQQNASSALADLLQRGGIQLGQVSVGAQQQSQERQGQGQNSTRGGVSSAARRTGTPGLDLAGGDTLRPQPPMRRSDGSRPLDLFV
jgi:flagellar hook-length control protein FliK